MIRVQSVGRSMVGVVVAGMVAVGAGCGSKGPSAAKPPARQQAAATRQQQEEQDYTKKMTAEQDTLAQQADAEEQSARRAQSQLPAEFGTSSQVGTQSGTSRTAQPGTGGVASLSSPSGIAPVPVPRPMPPVQIAGAVPYDQAFPPAKDHVVRVGIMSGSSEAGAGDKLARMLSSEDRKYLEETLGLGIQVAYVSETERPETGRSRVLYRVQFMKAAVEIAALVPQPQAIQVMSEAEAARRQVDILVQIGPDLN